MVKKGYRDPPYHNWMHAFSVTHFCYLLYKNLGLSSYLQYVYICFSAKRVLFFDNKTIIVHKQININCPISIFFRDIEILALFVSCMCHDLDHRGTNNSFQVASVRAQIILHKIRSLWYIRSQMSVVISHYLFIYQVKTITALHAK